jgi:hypothetical protein
MNNQKNTLAAVVDDFLVSLSDERKAELKRVILNSQLTTSWPWYKEVISSYLQGPDAKLLLDDIESHYPGTEFGNAVSGENPDMHAYEAEIILREAQKNLNK